MPQPYPNPSINTSTDLLIYANTVTDGWATTGFCVTAVIVIFLLMKSRYYRTSDSFSVAFVITFILGSIFWAMGILQTHILMVLLVGTIGSVLWSIFDQ